MRRMERVERINKDFRIITVAVSLALVSHRETGKQREGGKGRKARAEFKNSRSYSSKM
jgi:hypothetical protein